MLNILIPMAGKGSRFSKANYKKPKPLIEINGKTMIELVIKNLTPKVPHKFIFVVQKKHSEKYNLKELLSNLTIDPIIKEIDFITDGAASTVMEAEKYINNNQSLMIANSDQWIDIKIDDYLNSWDKSKYAGYIMTMKAEDPKWSYIRFGAEGKILDVVEKEVISNEATVGIYNFNKGKLFCNYARQMIEKKYFSKGEYYVAPVYKYLIKDGYKIGLFNINNDGGGNMHGLGTPDDLNIFLENFSNKL